MAPKSKPAATNGASKKPKADTPSGTASPAVSTTEIQELAVYGAGKPDKALYDAEQSKIKAEIDALQIKLVRAHADVSGFRKFHAKPSITAWNRMRSRRSSRSTRKAALVMNGATLSVLSSTAFAASSRRASWLGAR